MRKWLRILGVSALMAIVGAVVPMAANAEVIVVPPGNRNDKRPKIPALSRLWTGAISRATYEAKYHRIYTMLEKNRDLVSAIKKVSGAYGIDPIHMIGAIVGEHT